MTAASRPSLRENVTGRDEPRQPAAPAHDVRFGPVTVSCTCCPGWMVGLTQEHAIEFLQRIATEHETGEPA